MSKPDPDKKKKPTGSPKAGPPKAGHQKPRAKKAAMEPAAPAVPTRRRKGREPKVEGLIGVGLDNADGHTRITKGEHFVLLGGSSETHEQMQEFTIKLTERLAKQGKRIPDATIRELRDLVSDLKK
ncbi:MAG: hypothetical protein U1E39_07060 [Planctomycetota bacterium]